MARSRKKNRGKRRPAVARPRPRARSIQRDFKPSITKPSLLNRIKRPKYYDLSEIEDRRRPLDSTPKLLNSRPAPTHYVEVRPKRTKPKYKFTYSHYLPRRYKLKFKTPDQTIVCRRRKARREVIFATGNQGKGSKQSTRKRNSNSYIICYHRS